MSSDSTARLIFGIPCDTVIIKEEHLSHLTKLEIQEMCENDTYSYVGHIESIGNIERYIPYDASDASEQLIGIGLLSATWESKEMDVLKIMNQIDSAKEELQDYIENVNDCKLYLHSEYF